MRASALHAPGLERHPHQQRDHRRHAGQRHAGENPRDAEPAARQFGHQAWRRTIALREC
jgi:hypothetical protein